MPLVLGVDSSTQSTKVEARDLDSGDLVASGSAPHPAVQPPVSEQDPASWWAALVDAVSQLGDVRSDVVAMSVAGQQHGLVLLDDTGEAVRPAKLWNDTTSADAASRLVGATSATQWARACGSVPVAAFTVAKVAWMQEHEPESLARTARVLLPHDVLTWKLTGRFVTDRGDASGTGWFDPFDNTYRPELLAAAAPALDAAVLPEVLGPTEAAGVLTAQAAAALGLPASVIVGPGTGDNMAAALGLGLRPGDSVVSLGTSGTAYAVSASGTADPTGAVAGFADANGGFLPLVCTLNATKVTDTFAALMDLDYQGFADLALSANIGAGGPTLLPYLDGERTPNLPNARGALFGIETGVSRETIALAAHDGVLCGLLDGLDALSACDVSLDGRRFLVGGGARSAAYRQRYADLAQDEITVPDADETVATGAAVQAAAVASNAPIGDVATAWGCGAGVATEPRAGADGDVRARYAAATDRT